MILRFFFITLCLSLAHLYGMDEKQTQELPIFKLSSGATLVPYHRHDKAIKALEEIVNDASVYPMIRHGQIWEKRSNGAFWVSTRRWC
ncbi:MAG: hypothetical protein ACTSXG_04085 [Alphaproteobacteria bacterium]